jgi:pSer/pThr/pTyr-binding forkhead associated (FHA) protein
VDPRGTIFPELDLTDEGSRGKSVSRRHARIFLQDNLVSLEDLGSINGTFVNGRKLDPYMPEALRDGDMLQLGRIPMEIKILHRER